MQCTPGAPQGKAVWCGRVPASAAAKAAGNRTVTKWVTGPPRYPNQAFDAFSVTDRFFTLGEKLPSKVGKKASTNFLI